MGRPSLVSIAELEKAQAIVAIQDGNHGEKHPKSDDYVESGVPFIMASDLENGRVDLRTCKFIAKEQADSLRIGFAQKGDVLLTHKGTVGLVAIVPPVDNYIMLTPQVTYYRVDGIRLYNKYLAYAFREPTFQDRLRSISAQSTRPYVGITAQRDLKITFWPPKEQRKIASILSAYDDLIENNTRRIAILEEMARSLYREWFVHFRFPGHEKVKMVDSPLGKIPEGWSLSNVGEAAVNYDRLRRPLSKMQRERMKGPYPYYGAAKVFDFVNDYIFDGEYLLVAEDGSVVTTDGKPVLQRANGRFWANNHTHILQGKASVSTELLYLSLCEADVLPCITGAAQPKITQANLNMIPVVVAPSDLLDRFQRVIASMFRQIDVLELRTGNLRTTRDLLLPKLISGEIDVSDLDIEVPEVIEAEAAG